MKLTRSEAVVVFLTIFGFSNAYAASDELMLKATPFSKIENKIGKVPIMLEFGSANCHSCQVMGKVLYKIKEKHSKSDIYFIDIYKDMPAAKKFRVRLIPTQKFLDKKGNIVGTHMGVIRQNELEEHLKSMEIIK